MKEIGRQFATFSNHESSHADKTNARAKAFQEIANLTSMVNRGSIADFKYLTNLLVGLFQESTPVLIPRAVKQSNAAPDTTIVKYDPGHPRPRGGNAAKQREALQREPGQQSNKAAPARSSSHSDGAERPLLTHQFRDSPMGRRPVAVYVPSYADILISEPVSSKSESPFTILEKEDQIKQNDDLGQSTELEERFKKLEAAGIDVSDARRQMAEAPDYDSE